MEYIECPTVYLGKRQSLFVAGGITGCSDWQSDFIALLQPVNIAVLNPRRANFPIDDPAAVRAQITWEHSHLAKASAISFWFCPEALNPIALYELGYWIRGSKPIFVGTHPDYVRRQDVVIQTKLIRSNIVVVNSLEALANQVVRQFNR